MDTRGSLILYPPTDPRHLGRFFYLLLSIFTMLVLLPVAEQFRTGVPLLMCCVYATMWFAIHAVSATDGSRSPQWR